MRSGGSGSRFRLDAGLLLGALLLSAPLAPGPARGAGTPVGTDIDVLIIAVDTDELLPRTLQHHELGQVTYASWSNPSTLEHYAFQRDTSFAEIYDEMSYGEAKLDGDVALVSLPGDMGSLHWWDWADLADAAAQGQGFDLSSYDRFLYLFPDTPKDAAFAGLASGDRGWCRYTVHVKLDCIFHELGHTLGMVHGSELQADGSIQGYGDVADGLMGVGVNCHVSPVNKDHAGWLSAPRIHTVASSGSAVFGLAPQSSQSNTLQVLKVRNYGARPGIGVVDTFVSFRDANGFDEQLLVGLADLDGNLPANSVLVHNGFRVTGGDSLYVKSLQTGELYASNGVTVQVNNISAGGAIVTVTRDPYYPVAPGVSVTPMDVSLQPWSTSYYTVSITNPNPPQTPFDSHYEVTFSGSAAGWPRGWTSTEPKVVAPGETRDFDFWLDPPGDLGLGVYTLDIEVAEDGDVPVSTAVQATYTVVGPLDDTPPSVPMAGTVSPVSGSTVFVSWPASTDDLSGVAGYEVLRIESDGSFDSIGNTPWFGIVDENADPTDRYSVRAYDAAGNFSWWGPAFPQDLPPPLACGLGYELVGLLPPLVWLRGRRRRR